MHIRHAPVATLFFCLVFATCDLPVRAQTAIQYDVETGIELPRSGLQDDLQPAAHGTISGRVYDAGSNQPKAYVNVSVSGTLLGSTTDEQGRYNIPRVPVGTYVLMASYIGYVKETRHDIAVEKSETVTVDFRLAPAPLRADAVVITATRKEQTVFLTPASVDVVTANQMREKNVTTFDQALDGVSGVNITRSSGANVQALSIRGASEVAGGGIGNRVLLLIDGRPALSPESGGALWNLVPTGSIERIEVVKGAYSSLYGSSAMGGVVNILTRKPVDEPRTTVHLDWGFYDRAPGYTGFDQFRDFNTITVSHSRRVQRFSYLLDVSRKYNAGHRQKSGFNLVNLYGKSHYEFSHNRNIQLALNFNRVENDRPGTWLSQIKAYNVAPHKLDDDQDRREYNADLYYYAIPNENVKYSSRIFYYLNDSEYIFNADPGNDSTNINTGHQVIPRETILAARFGNVSQVDIQWGKRHYLIAGADLKFDQIDARPADVLYGKRKAYSLAAYVQDEITWTEALVSTWGIRYDYYEILNQYHTGNISPKISVLYRVSPDWSLRALWAQAFRNPSIGERFIQFEQGGGILFRRNPKLKAEKLTSSIEVGTKVKLNNSFSFDVAYFWNNYENLISYEQVSVPPEPLMFEVQNLNKAVIQGFEISSQIRGSLRALDLDARLNYTYLDARDESAPDLPEDNLPYKIRHTFNAALNMTYVRTSLNLSAKYNSAIKEVFIYPDSLPGDYLILDLRLQYRFNSNYSVYSTLNNLGDAQYEEIERYRMPGRSFSLGAEAIF